MRVFFHLAFFLYLVDSACEFHDADWPDLEGGNQVDGTVIGRRIRIRILVASPFELHADPDLGLGDADQAARALAARKQREVGTGTLEREEIP